MVIETERLLLRPFLESDAADVFEYLAEPMINGFPEHAEPHDQNEDSPLDTFSPCWMLNRAYHGKGYAYEAVHAFFDYLFREKDARRIYTYTEDYNISCQHLCEKLGMRREGLFMEFVSFVNNPDGTPLYENTYQYAILRREWN